MRAPKIAEVILRDDLSRRGFAISFFFWLTSVFLLAFFWLRLPSQIPLFYCRPWGEEQLASSGLILLLPSIIFLIFLVNFLLSSLLFEEKFILRILAVSSAICAFLGLLAQVKIFDLSLS